MSARPAQRLYGVASAQPQPATRQDAADQQCQGGGLGYRGAGIVTDELERADRLAESRIGALHKRVAVHGVHERPADPRVREWEGWA